MTLTKGAANRPIYLDHNATTPLDPGIVAALTPYLGDQFGNPSSSEHLHGHEAAQAVEHAREQVASAIGARASEIVFTGSCTEANNLAILGAVKAQPDKRHLVCSAVEHPSVLQVMRALEQQGLSVTYVGVDRLGMVDPQAVKDAITPHTALVTIMGANNEVGTEQPIQEIGEICSQTGTQFHSDLAQCVAYLDQDVEDCGLHLASVSAHKAYGPKGVGALYVRSRSPRAKIAAILHGGGQERGLRPGTLNVPWIVAMGEAFQICRKRRAKDSQRLRSLCSEFKANLQAGLGEVEFNGHMSQRLPNTVSVSIPGVEPLALIRMLRGQLSFSASSACSSHEVKTSHVLLAMFGESERARGAFRIAAGRFTEASDMLRAAELIVSVSKKLRAV